MQTTVKKSDRLESIDALRALAVLSVMLYHYTTLLAPSDRAQVLHVDYGYVGVQLFFILSGYCIYMTAEHCANASVFWARRLSRLQPAYTAGIALTFAAVWWFGLPEEKVGGLAAAANVLWLNAVKLVPSVDGVYWSLIVELKLYFLFGILFFILRDRGNVILWWAVLIVIGAAVEYLDRRMTGGLLAHYTSHVATFALPHSGYFLAGMLIFKWDSVGHAVKLFAIVAFMFCCWLNANEWVVLSILLLLLPLVKIAISSKLRFPTPILFLGFVSYPLYLIHMNIGLIAIREAGPAIPSVHARILVAVLVSIGLASIISFTVEHRFRKQLERWIVAGIASAIAFLNRGASLCLLLASRRDPVDAHSAMSKQDVTFRQAINHAGKIPGASDDVTKINRF